MKIKVKIEHMPLINKWKVAIHYKDRIYLADYQHEVTEKEVLEDFNNLKTRQSFRKM
jgi:hypothetical protein